MAVFGPPGGVGDEGLPEAAATGELTGEADLGEDYMRHHEELAQLRTV
jgi:hypothetical protein